MAQSDATVATANASRYLQQLCKHWSHKFAVEFDPAQGHIDLGEGRVCVMEASADTLTVHAQAPDAETLPRLEKVIADHIRRFAFREELVFDWHPGSS